MKRGFTLSEVLITVAIIGVVASIIIPSINGNIQKKELKQQLLKSYSEISRAFIATKQELGVSNVESYYTYWDGSKYPNTPEFVDAFMKQLKVIGTVTYKNPPRNFTNNANASTLNCTGNPAPSKLLPDGTSISTNICGKIIWISVDINGPGKRPNRLGYDIFQFMVSNKDVVIGAKASKLYTEEELENEVFPEIAGQPCSHKSSQSANGIGCAHYALIDKNPDDLNQSYWDSLD